jgi:hypothetical protein
LIRKGIPDCRSHTLRQRVDGRHKAGQQLQGTFERRAEEEASHFRALC